MSKRRKQNVSTMAESVQRENIAAAERELEAICNRRGLLPVVEQVNSSVAGQFTRFTFTPRPAPAPARADPVTAVKGD